MTHATAIPPAPHHEGKPANDYRWLRAGLILSLTCFAIALSYLAYRSTKAMPELTKAQITQFLRDEADPGGVAYALSQVRTRMERGQDVRRWYPEIVRLSNSRFEIIRHGVSRVLAADPSRPEFHEILLDMLHGDKSLLVRNSAAVGLAEFHDTAGCMQVIGILQPARVAAPTDGRVDRAVGNGAELKHGGVIATLFNGGVTTPALAPLSGRIRQMMVQEGDYVSAGVNIAIIEPSKDQVVDALRALSKIGNEQDLPLIRTWEKNRDKTISQQARIAIAAISERQRE